MNYQEIFNKVLKSVIKQGEPSFNEEGSCAYRGKNGTKCAVGFLIPDELYTERLELIIPSEIFKPLAEVLGVKNNDYNAYFFSRLQECHDMILEEDNFVDSFKYNMKKMAKEFGLKYDNT